MKTFNIKSRWSGFWAKGIKALLLLVVLQAYACPRLGWGSPKPQIDSISKSIVKAPPEHVSAMLDTYSSKGISDRLPSIFLAYLLENNAKTVEKLEIFLEYSFRKRKDFTEARLIEALNFCHRDYNNNTLIGVCIEERNRITSKSIAARSKTLLNTFKFLLNQKGIDINKARHEKEKNQTSTLFALANKDHEILNILLQKPNIDIKTIDSISGNTTVHWAITNGWRDEAIKLIQMLYKEEAYETLCTANKANQDTILHSAIKQRQGNVAKTIIEWAEKSLSSENLKEKALAFLFRQNKDGKTALHLAMKYEQQSIQDKLIKLGLTHENITQKLSSKDNKDRTAIDVGLEYKQNKSTIELIHHMPLVDDIFKPNKNKKILMDEIIRLRNLSFFDPLFYRIKQLKNTDSSNVVQQVKEYFKRASIWESIYLSKIKREPVLSAKENITMLEHTIKALKDILGPEDWEPIRDAILNNIKNKERAKLLDWFGGNISKSYVDELCKILNSTKPAA